MIRPVTVADAARICDIYNHYVLNSTATFEEEPVSEQEMTSRIAKVHKLKLPWLVLTDTESGQLTGYAYASSWNARSAYRFTAELSIYLHHSETGRGAGRKLMQALFDELEKTEIRTLVSGITLPNPASVALHEAFGMTQQSELKNVGFKFNRWLDVGHWHRSLP